MEQDSNLLKWRARSSDDVLWARFDEDYIAFQRPSGKTHFLNAASYILLGDLLAEPCDLDEIVEAFLHDGQEVDSTEYRGRLTELLDHLDILGLVDRV